VIRIAAVGDVHVGTDSPPEGLRAKLAQVNDDADVLLVAGDLTKCGTPEEAGRFLDEFTDVAVPIVAVLGNHDHHAGRPHDVSRRLADHGVTVLDGDEVVLSVGGFRLGVAGIKGFGGGFAGASATAFGEDEIKAFVHHSEDVARRLAEALARLAETHCDRRVALTHYAPSPDTLAGERLELFPFLGSQHLAEAVDEGGADLAIHGHAHMGTERGRTPGGVPVRNVAMPVIRAAYRVYELAVPMPVHAG
jgi:Icc-related predicted phosphoesterase